MKTLLLALLSIQLVSAQQIASNDLKKVVGVSYQETMSVDRTKDQLYYNAKDWFVYTYKSANHVIQLDDQANGKLVGKGVFSVPYALSYVDVGYTVTVEVKDGKYRYFIDQFSVNVPPYNRLPKGIAKKTDERVTELINSLHDYMQKTAPPEDW